MSLESALYDILSKSATVTAIAESRIYPLGVPQGKTGAAVVFQQIASSVQDTTGGQNALRTDVVQVTCWSAQSGTPDDARALAEVVRTALQAASGAHGGVTIHYCLIDSEGDAINIDTENERLTRYGKRQDWEITYE